MTMNPTLRKLVLTAHIALSVGWLGAAATYLVIAVRALVSGDAARMRAAYPVLELIGWSAILPLCGAALLSGVAQALGTRWGLLRHYWVAAKLALTLFATAVLLTHLPAVSAAARSAESVAAAPPPTRHGPGGRVVPAQIVIHAAGGVAVLTAITALSVFKPWGPTPRGRRALSARPSSIIPGDPRHEQDPRH